MWQLIIAIFSSFLIKSSRFFPSPFLIKWKYKFYDNQNKELNPFLAAFSRYSIWTNLLQEMAWKEIYNYAVLCIIINIESKPKCTKNLSEIPHVSLKRRYRGKKDFEVAFEKIISDVLKNYVKICLRLLIFIYRKEGERAKCYLSYFSLPGWSISDLKYRKFIKSS